MVKKTFCDKCEKEIDMEINNFNDMFNQMSNQMSFGFGKSSKIIKPQLCNECEKGYSKIIDDTNKIIDKYLKE